MEHDPFSRFRYGPLHDGPDPLAPPYDVGAAMDRLGDDVLAGRTPGDAMRSLLREGTGGRRGLDDLRREVRRRRQETQRRGRMDGTLDDVRRLLDTAVGQERAALFPDASDDARFRESQLDMVPQDTARAVRSLSEYDWRSAEARATFDQLKELLRKEVLDASFRGMKQALEAAAEDPHAMDRVKDMMSDLNSMLSADARGEHTQKDFDRFMARHGEFFPDQPSNLDELVDSLARRQAAAERMMRSLTPQQRQELADLSSAALSDLDLQSQMDQLARTLQQRRPDLDRSSRRRMSGETPLGMGSSVDALEDLADLEELEGSIGQDYPGATLEDVDEEAVRQALGRQAVDDLEALRRTERELVAQGYLVREHGRLELTPKAVRRIGATALRRVFASLKSTARGDHDLPDAGATGELTGSSRTWTFGDEQPIDVVRTVGNAVRRAGPGRRVTLDVEDFEVVETERRTSAAVALLVDLSYSMVLRDTWGAAKSTALALHSLATSQFPQDAVAVIGFANLARVLKPTELAGLDVSQVQGTNLQHALMLAGRFHDRHPESERIVLVVTDGEPTAHLTSEGSWWFDWPPAPETLELTLAEVDRTTRRGATINIFLLDDDPRLAAFVEEIARRNGGRVFASTPDSLGDYVVSDYLRMRRGRAGARR